MAVPVQHGPFPVYHMQVSVILHPDNLVINLLPEVVLFFVKIKVNNFIK